MQVASLFASLGLKVDGSSFSVGDKLISRIATGLKAIAAYEGVKFFTRAIASTLELGARIHQLAQSTGVGTEAIQAMGYAAEQEGVSTEGMANALGKLSRNMYQAQNGSKQAAGAFASLGVKVTDARGKLRPTEDVLQDISDHFKVMPDGAEKTALAIQVLGRSGKELIPLLNKGGTSLRDMTKEARDLGVVLDDSAIDKLDQANKSVKRIEMGLTGLKNQAVIALLPYLQKAADYTLAWLKANKAEVIKKLSAAVEWLGKVLGVVVKVVEGVATYFYGAYEALESLVKAVEDAARGSAILKDILIGVGAVLAVLAVAIEAPFLLGAGLIALLIIAIQDLYVWANGGQSVFGKFWQKLKDGHNPIVSIVDDFKELGSEIKKTAEGLRDIVGLFEMRSAQKDIDALQKKGEELGKQWMNLTEIRDAGYKKLVNGVEVQFDKKAIDDAIAEKNKAIKENSDEEIGKKALYNRIVRAGPEGMNTYGQDTTVDAVRHVAAKAQTASIDQAWGGQKNDIRITVNANEADAHKVVALIGQHLMDVLRQAQAQVGKR